jgi:Fe-S cluster assembly iron-binding protein IscA
MRAMLKNATHQSNLALKVSVVKRGCSGLTHKIDIVAPNEKDEIVTVKGIQ